MKRTNKSLLTIAMVMLPFVYAQAECDGKSWAPDNRYQIKGAEVYDKKSNLTWKRCAEGMNWNGTTCTDEPRVMTWDDALKRYSLSKHSSDDAKQHKYSPNDKAWRLPSLYELTTLFSGSKEHKSRWSDAPRAGCWNPAINTRIFPGEQLSYPFLSSSYEHSTFAHFVVDFNSGNAEGYYDTYRARGQIRLVRVGK
ncbi:Protein of unknown function [Formivibrio citricus]|uniref:Lcl C-terminal domain-containing protein n=1 Tax=Formivibrio citricus TaxID=83765 RepID=A0A1I5E3U5_9NEIS|nr:DUF1566 domain-containing protein [Formivibrio citricus]SFO05841.1 Protein of unknown function [Formivibrio citricus]